MSEYSLRRFNEEGRKKYERAVRKIKDNQISISEGLTPITVDESLTEIVDPEVLVEAKDFATRYDVAIYINEVVAQLDLSMAVLREDSGLWDWLAAFYFNQIVSFDDDGLPNVGAVERYVSTTYRLNNQRYYRHQIAGAWVLYKIHEDNPKLVEFLLCSKPYVHDDMVEQLASRVETIVNPGLLSAVRHLYWDEKKRGHKSGSKGRSSKGGQVRRIPAVFDQFKLTWDFDSMTVDEIMQLLPAEFDRFKK